MMCLQGCLPWNSFISQKSIGLPLYAGIGLVAGETMVHKISSGKGKSVEVRQMKEICKFLKKVEWEESW